MREALQQKIKSLPELRATAAALKHSGRKIVHCHGVFDLLHVGHIRHLNSAKDFGDILVVTLTSDRFVRRGPGRPVFNQTLRAEALANLSVVDFVCVVDYPTAIEAIIAIKPDFYVKGPDYKKKEDDITAKIFDEEDTLESVGGRLVFTDDLTFSSSQLTNAYFETYPPNTINYLKGISASTSADQILTLLKQAQRLKVLVIGDAIIDQYHYCIPLGKSAKESLVANKYVSEEDFAGGALATVNHVAQLTHQVELFSMLGELQDHSQFVRAHLDPYIKPHLLTRAGCVTTIKRRYVSTDANKKLFEIVFIDDHALTATEERLVLESLEREIDNFDLVIASDFGHGLITPQVQELLCARAKILAINVQTNSANFGFNMITKYRRADLVCIDERELRLATHDRFSPLATLLARIQKQLGCKQIIATMGPQGSLSYNAEEEYHECPALAHQSIDTIGAGDAFFSFSAVCFALGLSQDLVSFIGNAAGALKVQIQGNREPVKFVDLAKFIVRLLKI